MEIKARVPFMSSHPKFNPLNPKIKIWILTRCPLFISYRSSGEKIIKYQANSFCAIISIILMTSLFYKVLTLKEKFDADHSQGLKG